jgi:3-deoxy-manno-octulosonate cytidylyltransferase (CMP-KDO synthetase)
MKIFGIIPARYASSRFPGKPLALIGGKPMIQRVYERASQCRILSGVVVATDDDRISRCVKNFGGAVCMTSPSHKSGTERCHEAMTFFGSPDPADIIINIQGDEPFIDPGQIEELAGCFRDQEVSIGTLMKKIRSEAELFDPNVVKVVPDKFFRAILFSRQALPFQRGIERDQWLEHTDYYKHVGIYGYRADVLAELVKLPESTMEKAESLEQLRWIENGCPIHLRETVFESHAVDTPADLSKITNIT